MLFKLAFFFYVFLVTFSKLVWDLVRYGKKTAKQHNDSSWKAEESSSCIEDENSRLEFSTSTSHTYFLLSVS